MDCPSFSYFSQIVSQIVLDLKNIITSEVSVKTFKNAVYISYLSYFPQPLALQTNADFPLFKFQLHLVFRNIIYQQITRCMRNINF